ncbi:MAG: rhodanese-like domain-containing protein [Anaerolineales bacterium]|nr:rhodanese-like domain-containing protein [Anaerolineales bacterium]
MKRTSSLFFIIGGLLLVVAAWSVFASAQKDTAVTQAEDSLEAAEAQVPRIKVEDAKAAVDAGQAVIVDVRSVEAYQAEHARGAINLPLALFENDLANLPLEKDQWIITYCT